MLCVYIISGWRSGAESKEVFMRQKSRKRHKIVKLNYCQMRGDHTIDMEVDNNWR